MFSSPPNPGLQGSGETLAALLKSEPGAAFAIDVNAGTLVAANALAVQKLDLDTDTKFPYALDSAMPALARLRQFSSGQITANGTERVTFWIDGRRCPLLCSPKLTVFYGRPLVILSWHDQPAADAKNDGTIGHVHNSDARANDVARQLNTDDPLPVRSDADTLKAIARAIREGRPVRSSPKEDRSSIDAELPNTPPAVSTDQPVITTRASPANVSAQISVLAFDRQKLAELAHELKTPLSAIVAAAEIMRDQRLGPMGNKKYLDYASDVHDSANHAIAVISRMLDADRNRAEVQDPAFAPVDLNAVAARVISMMMPLAKSRGLTLQLKAQQDLAQVLADETAIRQIILNLLTNALKFTPRDGDVRVATGYLNDGGVFLVVRDTGTGMTQEAIETALNGGAPDETNSPRFGGGLGLGLPLVRSFVSANQATLEIDSAPDKGTVALIAFDRHRVVVR